MQCRQPPRLWTLQTTAVGGCGFSAWWPLRNLKSWKQFVAAIKSCLGWRGLKWALLWSVPCEKLWFGFLRTLHFQSDCSLEVWGSRHRITWDCRRRESGREALVQHVFHKSCLSVQNLINLPLLSHWLLGHCKVSLLPSHSWKDSCLPVPGLHFHMFSCSSENLWFLQLFHHPQILQDILIREMYSKPDLLNPAHSSKKITEGLFILQFLSQIDNSHIKMSSS